VEKRRIAAPKFIGGVEIVSQMIAMISMPTEKLYLANPYAVAFEAGLLACDKLSNGNFGAVLDRTLFYPESGGQLADKGKLAGSDVIDVRETEGGRILHEVSGVLRGEKIKGQVDWDVRFDHMQQHTGQHVLSRAFIETCKAETVSFHMGDETCTIDLDVGSLKEQDVARAESVANEVVWQDREVIIREIPASELADENLRKSFPEGTEMVRLVEIEEYDVCPCCGTHVMATGELGVIKILKQEKVKDTTRVYFKVGRRAFWDYQDKHDIVTTLSNRFTTAAADILDKVEKLSMENREARKAIQKVNRKILSLEKEQLLGRAREHKGIKLIVAVLKGADADYLKSLSASFKSENGLIAILGSDLGAAVCNASSKIEMDLSAKLVEAAKKVGGCGGGSGVFASVALPPSVDIANFLEEVEKDVRNTI
jgi:alanyl-tRNA synthetase